MKNYYLTIDFISDFIKDEEISYFEMFSPETKDFLSEAYDIAKERAREMSEDSGKKFMVREFECLEIK